MRISEWNPNKFDRTFEKVAMNRLIEAAEVIRDDSKRRCPVGTLQRPIYKTGPYAGAFWTARDGGALKKSIRVVRKKTKSGKALSRKRNVRIYAGTEKAYYAMIVEHATPFLRPAQEATLDKIKQIIGAGEAV